MGAKKQSPLNRLLHKVARESALGTSERDTIVRVRNPDDSPQATEQSICPLPCIRCQPPPPPHPPHPPVRFLLRSRSIAPVLWAVESPHHPNIMTNFIVSRQAAVVGCRIPPRPALATTVAPGSSSSRKSRLSRCVTPPLLPHISPAIPETQPGRQTWVHFPLNLLYFTFNPSLRARPSLPAPPPSLLLLFFSPPSPLSAATTPTHPFLSFCHTAGWVAPPLPLPPPTRRPMGRTPPRPLPPPRPPLHSPPPTGVPPPPLPPQIGRAHV